MVDSELQNQETVTDAREDHCSRLVKLEELSHLQLTFLMFWRYGVEGSQKAMEGHIHRSCAVCGFRAKCGQLPAINFPHYLV